ncbi:hypothetical protein [Salegentibacter salinarum]|uniref:hypothetical protein n=1 Tax=Salegentibacter salinarum TaxID=447422 RepID=UPI0009A5F3C2|nr:hypothetical protein [Salegentibacter salinarum]
MRKVFLSKWNAKANKINGSSAEAKQVNRNLDIIKNKVYEVYQRLRENDNEITAVKIKDEFFGKNIDDHKILKILKIIIQECKNWLEKIIPLEHCSATIQPKST